MIPVPVDLYQPVTVECVQEVSRRWQVPVEIIAGILAQEDGRLGQASPNRDGSKDLGPMQINTFWLPLLVRYGVSDQHLLWHGCYNVAVGVWIVRYEQARSGGDLWRAVGRYHSHDPERAEAYVRKVAGKIRRLASSGVSLQGLLQRVNHG